jgi:putative sugar O-methyltransferase
MPDSLNLWQSWNKDLNFLKKISDEELRMHVGFLYLLGSPIESDYWLAQNFSTGKTDSSSIMSHDNNQQFNLNRDVLRTQCDVSNIFKFGIMGKITRITEVGGGYGQLAAAFTRILPGVKYTIVDLPPQLEIQKRWLSHIGLNVGEHGDNQVNLVSSLDYKLIQQDVDLLINVNSFCEMGEVEIRSYLDRSNIDYKWLYSNNREVQFMNKELTKPLSEIFQDYFETSPSLSSYLTSDQDYTKYVFLGGQIHQATDLPPSEIVGVRKWYNPLEVN